jgi:hypothetical protein
MQSLYVDENQVHTFHYWRKIQLHKSVQFNHMTCIKFLAVIHYNLCQEL